MSTDSEEQSAVSQEIKDLKNSVIKAAASRTHLPQPLFWSLFHSRLKEIKEKKSLKREIEELLGS